MISQRISHNKNAFTLVELIVVAAILILLTSIGFISYTSNISDARDSQRKSDISQLKGALNNQKIKQGAVPIPGSTFNIVNSGAIVATQGKLNTSVLLSNLDSLPKDPSTKEAYVYSTTTNRQEFDVAGTLENGDYPRAILDGNYKTVAIDVLPTLVLAISGGSDIEISRNDLTHGVVNRTKFVYDGAYHNLPYTFGDGNAPFTDNTPFDELLSDPNIEFWQNSSYRSCNEIKEALKTVSTGYTEQYQIMNGSGVLTNTGCTF